MIWRDQDLEPLVIGPKSMLGIERPTKPGQTTTTARFGDWLEPAAAVRLTEAVRDLRANAKEFDWTLGGRNAKTYRLAGRVRNNAHILRVSPASSPAAPTAPEADIDGGLQCAPDLKRLVDGISVAAFAWDDAGQIRAKNRAFLELAPASDTTDVQINPALEALEAFGNGKTAELKIPGLEAYVLTPVRLEGGGLCLATAKPDAPEGAAPRNAQADNSLASYFQTAIDQLPTPIAMFDGRARLTLFNHAYADLWTLDRDWLATGPTEHTILDRLRLADRLPHEANYRKWRAAHLRAYGLEQPRHSMWVLPNGQTLNILASPASTSQGKGVIYVFDNSTERLDLERKMNAIVSVQRETLEALSEAVVVFGTDGRLKLYNSQISGLWGVPLNTLEHLPHIDQIAEAAAKALPEDGARIWEDLKKLVIDFSPDRQGKRGRIERTDGRLIDFSTVRLPDGQTLMTFADVTKSTKYERVLKERNEALVTADRVKDAFVRNVSYELRSPLTSIIGFSDMLYDARGAGLTDQQKTYVDYIRASSQALMLIIDNILVLANVDAGIIDLHPEPVNIAEVIDNARAGVAATLKSDGIVDPANIEIDIEPELPRLVADPLRIIQILFNLLSNAVRYSDPGAPVRLSVTSRPDRIIFTVEDEGAGIPDEAIASVFDRFEGSAANGRQRGTGLGLSIVSTFVHLHGGTVKIERRKPRGTTVMVNLPAEQRAYGT